MEFSKMISNMDAMLFASTLETSLLQIRILEGSTDLRIQPQKHYTGKEKLQTDKLLKEREMAKDVLKLTLVELSERGEWSTLREAAGILQEHAEAAEVMCSKHEQLRASREAINDELKTKRNQYAAEIRNMDLKIAFLRDEIKNEDLNAKTRLSYAEKWLCAKVEALDLRCRVESAPLPRVGHESRVHGELLRAYNLQIKELEVDLEKWRQRFRHDTTKISERLVEKRELLRVVSARREELQKLYRLHEGEIRSWLTFKSERAARLAREERRRACAVRVQAWWRGVMVRRCFGQFRYLRNLKKTPNKNKKK